MTEHEKIVLDRIKEIVKEDSNKIKSVKVCHYLLFGKYKIMSKVTFADRRDKWIK